VRVNRLRESQQSRCLLRAVQAWRQCNPAAAVPQQALQDSIASPLAN